MQKPVKPKTCWVANDPGSNGIWKPNRLKSDKWQPNCQKPFKIWTKMSGFRMVGTIAIAEAQPIENPTFKKSGFFFVTKEKFIVTSHCNKSLQRK